MAKNELLKKVDSINKLFDLEPYKEGAYKLDIAYGGYQINKNSKWLLAQKLIYLQD